ncbi:hypothetical protein DBT_0729 [Dissulfuribacter thermophilus]|uniref:DUF434 domain-containing protein n=1 Tax=Dissulfuribacter thermophilus TaxID=1156395 RepID=A0A1B9F7I0_9BACT|nr:DUF434 domain-containing protein [Dissulfuribacter thermophilus]OCC15804.1 hypothetical protein DBT_0729 [Dissulfuribacter thermophilus]
MKHLRLERLKPAAIELRFLLSHGYPRKSCVEFVGNHHQLTREERNVLFRGVFSKKDVEAIKKSKIPLKHLENKMLFIDGYNVTITIENALKGNPIIKGNDGVIRDISCTFRGFRQSELTQQAWDLICALINRYSPKKTIVLLDKPYSRSGDFACSLRKWFKKWKLDGAVLLSSRVDLKLKYAHGIRATSDSTILIRGGPSIDISGHIAIRKLRRVPLIVP